MRRAIDLAIPACAAIGCWPYALRIFPLPPSIGALLGESWGWVWAATVALSFTLISVGVIISKRNPASAFWLAAIPFSYIGAIFGIIVVALFTLGPISRVWSTALFDLGIALYCFGRDWELFTALQRSKHSNQQAGVQ